MRKHRGNGSALRQRGDVDDQDGFITAVAISLIGMVALVWFVWLVLSVTLGSDSQPASGARAADGVTGAAGQRSSYVLVAVNHGAPLPARPAGEVLALL